MRWASIYYRTVEFIDLEVGIRVLTCLWNNYKSILSFNNEVTIEFEDHLAFWSRIFEENYIRIEEIIDGLNGGNYRNFCRNVPSKKVGMCLKGNHKSELLTYVLEIKFEEPCTSIPITVQSSKRFATLHWYPTSLELGDWYNKLMNPHKSSEGGYWKALGLGTVAWF